MSLDYDRIMSKIIKSRSDAIKRCKDENYINIIGLINAQIGLAALAINQALDIKLKAMTLKKPTIYNFNKLAISTQTAVKAMEDFGKRVAELEKNKTLKGIK